MQALTTDAEKLVININIIKTNIIIDENSIKYYE